MDYKVKENLTMKMLRDTTEVEMFKSAIDACRCDVVLRSIDGSEEFDLKSEISRRIAIGRLCGVDGDDYEVFCLNRSEMGPMLNFFRFLRERKQVAPAT